MENRYSEFNIGDRIFQLRLEFKITQAQLADKLYTSKMNVLNWEKKRSMPKADVIALMANLFDKSIDWFFTETKIERTKEYSIYKNSTDELIVMGSVKECAHALNMKENTIYSMLYNQNHGRSKSPKYRIEAVPRE